MWFLLGLWIGAAAGVFIGAVLAAGARDRRHAEQLRRAERRLRGATLEAKPGEQVWNVNGRGRG